MTTYFTCELLRAFSSHMLSAVTRAINYSVTYN